MNKFCCQEMHEKVCCIDLEKSCDCDKVIFYSSRFNEYGIPVCDGERGTASSYVLIQHCPWCGKPLPKSKRDEWFDLLERMGYDSPLENNVPEEFKTSAWYEPSLLP